MVLGFKGLGFRGLGFRVSGLKKERNKEKQTCGGKKVTPCGVGWITLADDSCQGCYSQVCLRRLYLEVHG